MLAAGGTAGGSATGIGFITRLNGGANGGQVDTTFAGDGTYELVGGNEARVTSLAMTSSGGIVAAGRRHTFIDGILSEAHVIRLLPDGSPDTSFSGDGDVADITLGGFGVAEPTSVIIDGQGRTYVLAIGDGDLHVARYLPDGRRDPAWGIDGQGYSTLSPAGAVVDHGANLVGLPDGKVLVGASAIQWSVVRLKGDGTFPSFDRGDIDTVVGGPAQGDPDNVPIDARDVLVTQDGTTYVVSQDTHLVYKIKGSYSGGRADPVLGDGRECSQCAGPADFPRLATTTPLGRPISLAFDEERQELFVATQEGQVYAVDQAGVARLVIASCGCGSPDGGDNGPASSGSAFNQSAFAIAFDPALRTLFIASGFNGNRVRAVNIDADSGEAGTLIPIANVAHVGSGYAAEPGPASSAIFNQIRDLIVDPATGDLYLSDSLNFRVRRIAAGANGVIDPSDTITTVAGNGLNTPGGFTGPATTISITAPRGLARTAAGHILITRADFRIYDLDPVAGTLSQTAGNGTVGELNGPTVTFFSLEGIDVAPNGEILVSDASANLVRRVSAAGNSASRVAGYGGVFRSGSASYRDDPDNAASLNGPSGLTIRRNPSTQENELWVSEGGVGGNPNHVLSQLSPSGSFDERTGPGLNANGMRDVEWSEFHQRFVFVSVGFSTIRAYDPVTDTGEIIAGIRLARIGRRPRHGGQLLAADRAGGRRRPASSTSPTT